jgi:hypothetical protein
MRKLMQDFDIEVVHAAGVLGNLGHECNGFQTLHEIGQPEGKGGYGWAQWTGPRRRQFLGWCDEHNLNWKSDEANYGFLHFELSGPEKGAIAAILKTSTLASAVKAFERNYERAGTPNYESRNKWGAIALDAFKNSQRGA